MAALQMATINTAEHFGVDRQVGMIAPGRWANILVVNDLKDFHADLVLVCGKIAAEHGKLRISLPKTEYPKWATKSVHLKKSITVEDFKLRTNTKAARVTCNVIGVVENQAPTKALKMTLPVKDGEVRLTAGVAKAALVERHHKTGIVQLGLVSGFGFNEECAIASTVAHDCHHMLVVGTNDRDMVIAANKLAETYGGQVVVKNGKIIGLVELCIGGLMSTEKAEKVAKKTSTILEGFKACGCGLNNPNMTLSLLALVVIPELRLSDKGLVDVVNFTTRPVIEGPAE
jgi:adenine deaminase